MPRFGWISGAPGSSAACGIGHRLQHFVFDVDQLGRFASQPLRVGDDAGDDVAAAASLLADRDEHGPIFFDEADVAVAGHIGGGDDAMDALERQRAAWRRSRSTFARG